MAELTITPDQLKELLLDKEFHGFPIERKLQFLREHSPDFAQMSPHEQGEMLNNADRMVRPLPTQNPEGKGFLETMGKHIAGIPGGIKSAVMHPGETIDNIIETGAMTMAKGQNQKNWLEKAAYYLGGAIPVVGPMAVQAGEKLGAGQIGEGSADALMAILGASPANSAELLGGLGGAASVAGGKAMSVGKGVISGVGKGMAAPTKYSWPAAAGTAAVTKLAGHAMGAGGDTYPISTLMGVLGGKLLPKIPNVIRAVGEEVPKSIHAAKRTTLIAPRVEPEWTKGPGPQSRELPDIEPIKATETATGRKPGPKIAAPTAPLADLIEQARRDFPVRELPAVTSPEVSAKTTGATSNTAPVEEVKPTMPKLQMRDLQNAVDANYIGRDTIPSVDPTIDLLKKLRKQ